MSCITSQGAPRNEGSSGLEAGASVRRVERLTDSVETVELIGPYYNTKQQVTTLEALIKSLPDPSAPFEPGHLMRLTRTARPLPTEQADELVAAYVAGDSVHDLSQRFRVSKETVNQIVRRRGIPPRPRGLSPEQIDEAERLYGDGWSLARIGERMDVDARTVHRRLVERGVAMRDRHARGQ